MLQYSLPCGKLKQKVQGSRCRAQAKPVYNAGVFEGKKKAMESLNQRYQRDENFVFRQIEGETILVPIKDNVGDMGSIYNLNPTGAFIWQQLNGTKPLDEIAMMLTREFDVSAEQAQADLRDFINQLEEIDALKAG